MYDTYESILVVHAWGLGESSLTRPLDSPTQNYISMVRILRGEDPGRHFMRSTRDQASRAKCPAHLSQAH